MSDIILSKDYMVHKLPIQNSRNSASHIFEATIKCGLENFIETVKSSLYIQAQKI